jgi:hypothetical protein
MQMLPNHWILQSTPQQQQRALQRSRGNDDPLRLDDDLPLRAVRTGKPGVAISRSPCPLYANRRLLATHSLKDHFLNMHSLNKGRPRLRCIRQKRHNRPLLLRSPAAKSTKPIIMRMAPRILRNSLMRIPQLPRTLKQRLIPMIMLDMFRTHTHPITNPIKTRLELRGREKRKPPIRPLLPHHMLRLQTGRPIHGPAAAPGAARDDGHRVVVCYFQPAVHEDVGPCFGLFHGEVRRREVVCLLDDNDAVACLGEVGSADSAAAAGSDDYDVCVESLGGVIGWELEEVELKALAWLDVRRRTRHANNLPESG